MSPGVIDMNIHRVEEGTARETQDVLAVEEPLVDGRNISITMRTPVLVFSKSAAPSAGAHS
jgi:hypothetical protein